MIGPEWVMSGGSAAALPCVLFGAWQFVQRILAASAKESANLVLGMTPIGMIGALLGHSSDTDQSLGGVILFGFMLLLVMLCCLVGATLMMSKHTRSFSGSIGFEIAAVFSSCGVLGIALGALSR